MALPFDGPKWTDDYGVEQIDANMTPETAQKQKDKHGNMGFMGAGAHGVAALIDGDKVIKYTIYETEANMAKFIMKNKRRYPVVEVYDVERVQKDPSVWAITMERARKIAKLTTNQERILWVSLTPISLSWNIKPDNSGMTKDGRLVVFDLHPDGPWMPPKVDWDKEDMDRAQNELV